MPENLHLINNTDIVCFSLSRWDSPISSPAVALAKELSKKHRVFFIEHPHSLKDIIFLKDAGKFIRKNHGGMVTRNGNVIIIKLPTTLPVNFLPEGFLYNNFSSINNAIVLKTLRLVIKEMDIKSFIFINFFDPFFFQKLPADIKPLKYIYQCMDDLSQVEYTRKHGVRLEEKIIKYADITLCTSKELTRIKSAISPSTVHFHPNAADIELFKTAFAKNLPKPADIEYGDKKIIGFTGSIEYRTDFELLKKIAVQNQDKILFLIGPVIGEEHIRHGLHQLPNIVFAGHRHITELPAYLQYFDCCIIPYKKNTLTRSIYPLKINEYLAAGKPVVATDFSEDISSFAEVAYIAEDHNDFIRLLQVAIENDNVNRKYERLNIASGNSWEKRVEQFWSILDI